MHYSEFPQSFIRCAKKPFRRLPSGYPLVQEARDVYRVYLRLGTQRGANLPRLLPVKYARSSNTRSYQIIEKPCRRTLEMVQPVPADQVDDSEAAELGSARLD